MAITQQHRPLQVHTPLGEDVLLFRTMTAHERLGGLFKFDLTVLSVDPGVKLEDLLGQSVTVQKALQSEGQIRYFNGIVSRFAQTGVHGRFYVYHATLRPWLWLLSRTQNCRIFQAMTVPDILMQVFRDHGFTDVDHRLSTAYRRWDYCVQYNESDFAFVSRLMEQEGIYYYFRHENDRHVLVLADDIAGHDPAPDYEVVPYFPPQHSLRRERDHLCHWSVSRSVQPGRYVLDDFDFQRPTADLSVSLAKPADHAMADFEVYAYPGEYSQSGDGEHYVRTHLEAFQARHERMFGFGNARGLAAGGLFTLESAPRDDQNRQYLVVAAKHELRSNEFESSATGSEKAPYSISLTALDSQVPFRSTRGTAKPAIPGPQTAIVVGKAGEEIWTDDHGRVKVQFHWDRNGKSDKNSTCWLRVSQSWAGNGWGAMHLPRIGQEVIVHFMEGDPDRPILTGRVYNGDHPVPYGLPANATQSGIKSRSSKGGGDSNYNELRFEDKKGQEHIHLQAEKDYTRLVKNNETAEIQADHTLVIKGEHAMTITNASRHEAKTVVITAADSGELSVGGSRLEMASSSINLTGTQITLSGSATVTVKGGVIKLN